MLIKRLNSDTVRVKEAWFLETARGALYEMYVDADDDTIFYRDTCPGCDCDEVEKLNANTLDGAKKEFEEWIDHLDDEYWKDCGCDNNDDAYKIKEDADYFYNPYIGMYCVIGTKFSSDDLQDIVECYASEDLLHEVEMPDYITEDYDGVNW